MVDVATDREWSSDNVIPIHFDVPGHFLPLETFVATANHTRTIVDTFNREFFDGKLVFELLVLPPQEGTFLTRLGIAIAAGIGVVWAFTNSDVGKAFIKGLSGHEPSYFAERAGDYIRKQIILEEQAGGNGAKESSRKRVDIEIEREVETRIITEATKGFLQKDELELSRIGVSKQRFLDAFDARNQFYQACVAKEEIRAIGFDESENFPIKRQDFARLQVALIPREDVPTAVEWDVEIVTLRVTSPNWDKSDEKRPWKAKDMSGNEKFFRIDDEHFWHLVHSKRLDPQIVDTIQAQWAFIGTQRRSARVLKVLKYNEQPLGDPLDDGALATILGQWKKPDEKDLFSQ